MGIMTRDTSQFGIAFAFLITPTGEHLWHNPNELGLSLIRLRPDEVSKKFGQRQSRSILKSVSTASNDTLGALKMTLKTDILTQGRIHVTRVGNGRVGQFAKGFIALGQLCGVRQNVGLFGNMKLARPMASLTSDCLPMKHPCGIAVY
jgi:hypothetical protein